MGMCHAGHIERAVIRPPFTLSTIINTTVAINTHALDICINQEYIQIRCNFVPLTIKEFMHEATYEKVFASTPKRGVAPEVRRSQIFVSRIRQVL